MLNQGSKSNSRSGLGGLHHNIVSKTNVLVLDYDWGDGCKQKKILCNFSIPSINLGPGLQMVWQGMG
jgi:hypothetical protein